MRSCSEGLQRCLLLPPSVAKQHYNLYILFYLVGASTQACMEQPVKSYIPKVNSVSLTLFFFFLNTLLQKLWMPKKNLAEGQQHQTKYIYITYDRIKGPLCFWVCQTPEQWGKVGFEETSVSVHTRGGAGICMAIQCRYQIQCSPGLMAIWKTSRKIVKGNLEHATQPAPFLSSQLQNQWKLWY